MKFSNLKKILGARALPRARRIFLPHVKNSIFSTFSCKICYFWHAARLFDARAPKVFSDWKTSSNSLPSTYLQRIHIFKTHKATLQINQKQNQKYWIFFPKIFRTCSIFGQKYRFFNTVQKLQIWLESSIFKILTNEKSWREIF